eukprot:5594338-Amphidinium_carterae.1
MTTIATLAGFSHVAQLLTLWKPIKYATKDTTKAANNKKTLRPEHRMGTVLSPLLPNPVFVLQIHKY